MQGTREDSKLVDAREVVAEARRVEAAAAAECRA